MKLISDATIPDGQFDGLSAEGVVIVRTVYTPVYERLIGTQEDEAQVVEWRTSPRGIKRLAAAQVWVANGAHTWGNA